MIVPLARWSSKGKVDALYCETEMEELDQMANENGFR